MNRRRDQLDRRQPEGRVPGSATSDHAARALRSSDMHLTRGILHRAPGQCGPGVGPQQWRRRSDEDRHQQLPRPVRLPGCRSPPGPARPAADGRGLGQRVPRHAPKPLQRGRGRRAAVTGRRPGVHQPTRPRAATDRDLRPPPPPRARGRQAARSDRAAPSAAPRPRRARRSIRSAAASRFRGVGPGSHRRQRVLLIWLSSNRSDQPPEGVSDRSQSRVSLRWVTRCGRAASTPEPLDLVLLVGLEVALEPEPRRRILRRRPPRPGCA